MALLFITPKARADEMEIYCWLMDKAGYGVVKDYQQRFDKFYSLLADFPARCAPCRALGRSVRIGYVRPYAIIYRYYKAKSRIEIVRIVHSKRLITRKIL